MKKLILLLAAVLAVLVIMLLSSIGQTQSADSTPAFTSTEHAERHGTVMAQTTEISQGATQQHIRQTQYVTEAAFDAQMTVTVQASLRNQSATAAARAAQISDDDIDAAATALHASMQGTPSAAVSGCGGDYHDAAHEAACDAYRAEYEARHGIPCGYDINGQIVCLHDPAGEWTWDDQSVFLLPTAVPRPGDPTGPGGPTEPGAPTGPVHTVGESLFDIDAAATALHQMIHSPDDPRAFRSICDLPPNSPAVVAACDLYKAAYRLRHGNPCRHNDEGEAVCLH